MSTKKKLLDEIEVTNSFKSLVEIYGEIASIRMMKIRNNVLKNRDYIFAITQIFYDALSSYLRNASRKAMIQRSFRNNRITFLSHNGKMVFVLVSSNTGFYGDVITSSFKRFSSELSKVTAEVTIIGRTGREIFKDVYPGRPYTFFELPDYGSEKEKLLAVINHLVQYDEVRVYYSAYDTVLNQKPTVANLTAGATLLEKASQSKENYIFEPSVEDILTFFEKEVFASFVDQTIKESQLSKLSGRILAMDRASITIKNKLKEINFEYLKAKHRLINKKQQNMLSSFTYN